MENRISKRKFLTRNIRNSAIDPYRIYAACPNSIGLDEINDATYAADSRWVNIKIIRYALVAKNAMGYELRVLSDIPA